MFQFRTSRLMVGHYTSNWLITVEGMVVSTCGRRQLYLLSTSTATHSWATEIQEW
jgi:hypothetical protein